MNIFILDQSPEVAAQLHCDKHVVKMILESAQMLSTALRSHGVDVPNLYKSSHARHPCTVWVAESRENFGWLVRLARALGEEHRLRYTPKKPHASLKVVDLAEYLGDAIPAGPLSPFALAMPDEHRGPDAVESYRSYYRAEKSGIATWREPRSTPGWMTS